jgi:hypothetical protein
MFHADSPSVSGRNRTASSYRSSVTAFKFLNTTVSIGCKTLGMVLTKLLTIISKQGVLYLNKVNLKDHFTLLIRHPVKNINRKKFVRSFSNMVQLGNGLEKAEKM